MMISSALVRSRDHRPGDSGGLPANGKADSIAGPDRGQITLFRNPKGPLWSRGVSNPCTPIAMNQVAFAFWMTVAGTCCWVVCFIWMHRISEKQNHFLEK